MEKYISSDESQNQINIHSDVQINYSDNETTLNLFSIFENENQITDSLFDILKEAKSDIDIEIMIQFNEDNIIFLYNNEELSLKLTVLKENFEENFEEKFEENVSYEDIATILGEPLIVDFYTFIVHLWTTHITKILQMSSIIDFLKKTNHCVSCRCMYLKRKASSQFIHTDSSLFASLTYENPTLTPELIFVPRLQLEPHIPLSQFSGVPRNVMDIYTSIQTAEQNYYTFHGVSPVLRFNIENFKNPNIIFSDFVIFHSTPHTEDKTHEEMITNMLFDERVKPLVNYDSRLKPCLGRQDCKINQNPKFRSFLANLINLTNKNVSDYTVFRTVNLNTLVSPTQITTVDINSDIFEIFIENTIQQGKILGTNLIAKGGDKLKKIKKTNSKKQSKKQSKNKRHIL